MCDVRSVSSTLSSVSFSTTGEWIALPKAAITSGNGAPNNTWDVTAFLIRHRGWDIKDPVLRHAVAGRFVYVLAKAARRGIVASPSTEKACGYGVCPLPPDPWLGGACGGTAGCGGNKNQGDCCPRRRSRRPIVVGTSRSPCCVPASMTQRPDGAVSLVTLTDCPV